MNQLCRNSLTLLVCGLTIGVSSNALAYDQVFHFGDSLSDTGNFLNLSGGVSPTYPFYFPGRFSDNLVWVEYLNNQLGLNPDLGFSLDPMTGVIPPDGLDFALGGATTTNSNIAPLPGFPGLQAELGLFSALQTNGNNSNTIDPNALYTFWAGANDYLGFYYTPQAIPSTPVPSDVVGNISNALASLAQGGAKTILVGNLPNLGDIPFAQNQGATVVSELNDFTIQHNTLLEQSIQTLRQTYPMTNFIDWDVNALFADFFANPSKYGFVNPSIPCSQTDLGTGTLVPSIFPGVPVTCADGRTPNQTLFWESQHPSSKAHQFIAESAARALGIPEPSSLIGITMMGLGFVGKVIAQKLTNKP